MANQKQWLRQENLAKLETWAKDGLLDYEIAEKIGITTVTLKRWREKNVEIDQALNIGREMLDLEVENAIFKKAKGYYIVETIVEEKDGPSGITSTKREVKKYVPPDTRAQIFWLKNRKGERWSDSRQADNSTMNSECIIEIDGVELDD